MGPKARLPVFLLVTFHLFGECVQAARRVDAHLRARETLRQRRNISVLQRRDDESLDAQELFQLSKGETMQEVRAMPDAMGTVVQRLEEKYNGIKVMDAVVTVKMDTNGQLTGDASGTLIQDIDKDLPDTDPVLDDNDTLAIVIKAEGDDDLEYIMGGIEYTRLIYLDDDDKARLVNLVTYLIDAVKRPFYIIDVKNGDILQHWNGLNNIACNNGTKKYKAVGGNVKKGKITYGKCPYCLSPTISDDGETCYLENEYVRVVDMMSTNNESIVETASFPCKHGYNDSVNGAYSPAVDAFFYGTVVGKMFEDWFETTPLEDKVVLRVHWNASKGIAFWNGKNCTFSDGGEKFYPVVSQDSVAHEIAHGIIGQGSTLLYFYQSGSVNEAFADIIGETAEHYLLSNDFLVGANLMKKLPYYREFEFPENDNESISQASDIYREINVHHGSGVFRRAWYVIVKQENMPIRDAAEVFLYANKMYWHMTGTFYDCSCGLLKAAVDLGHSTLPFVRGFTDVGIKSCDIANHVVYLSNNKTKKNIVISDTKNPVFKFELPLWAADLHVEATSANGSVNITVLDESWTGENVNDITIETGMTNLHIVGISNTTVFIKLSSDDLNNQLAEVTAGYTCNGNFNVTNAIDIAVIIYICNIESD